MSAPTRSTFGVVIIAAMLFVAGCARRSVLEKLPRREADRCAVALRAAGIDASIEGAGDESVVTVGGDDAPDGMLSDVIDAETAVRFGATFPSSAPAAPVVVGLEKSSESTPVHVPVVRLDASRLYSKSSRSARPVVPRRHCSPTKAMSRLVSVDPVLFWKQAPIVGMRLPLWSPPNARSALLAAPKL